LQLAAGFLAMAVRTTSTTEEVCVSIDGDLDLATVSSFQSAVEKAIEGRAGKRLVIDLRETNYIDSAGLEQLLIANRKLAQQGERLLVRVLQGRQPQTVLAVTGFSAVMDVEPMTGTA
jgi:anti-anti-sigma factor